MNNHLKPIYKMFADLLEYPSPMLQEIGREGCELMAGDYPLASEKIRNFLEFIESTPDTRLEEIYTVTFDLNPVCYPYPGFHLFGESYKRGEFLAKLRQKYRDRGFVEEGNELADRLSVMLRFLATLEPEETLARELIEDCLIPALHKMNAGFKEGNPYASIFQALLSVLEPTSQTARAPCSCHTSHAPCPVSNRRNCHDSQ